MTILVTAFEPFGLIGKHLRGQNASIDIIDGLAKSGVEGYDSLVLPVSDLAETILAERLQVPILGVLCLGEDLALLPSQVLLEPVANDAPLSLLPFSFAKQTTLSSSFVKAAYPEQKKSGIGRYYCNRIYRTALKWSQCHANTPVAFMHLAVLGSRESQLEKVIGVFNRMQHHISAKGNSSEILKTRSVKEPD
jgi:pyrrolidone-carboxylate peptidase